MDDDRLYDVITSLEIINHKLNTLASTCHLEGEAKNLLEDSRSLLKNSMELLRGEEIKNEIKGYVK